MKKISIIGLLIISLIFQNCNNKTAKDAVPTNKTETNIETPKVDETVKLEEDIPDPINTETNTTTKIDKEVIKATESTTATTKKEIITKEII